MYLTECIWLESSMKDGTYQKFALKIESTTNSVFGDGTIEFTYLNESDSLVKLEKNTSVLFNKDETHDITITYNGDTKELYIYQDNTIVRNATIPQITMNGLRINRVIDGKNSFDSIEIYNGIKNPE